MKNYNDHPSGAYCPVCGAYYNTRVGHTCDPREIKILKREEEEDRKVRQREREKEATWGA